MTEVKREFYPGGSILGESILVDGKPHGIHREWYISGIIKSEIPYDHGVIDGVARYWNDRGELMGTSHLQKGTGILRIWCVEQGLRWEIGYLAGRMTGRHLTYCNDKLIATNYWLNGKKVSKKRYDNACHENSLLPRYNDDSTACSVRQQNIKKERQGKADVNPIQTDDSFSKKLLTGTSVREALGWLNESCRPSRSLGEATDQHDSITLVKELYSLGAISVHAVEIDGGINDDQNTGRLVIELPAAKIMRAKLLGFCGKIAKELGFDPIPDTGQRYLFLMLD